MYFFLSVKQFYVKVDCGILAFKAQVNTIREPDPGVFVGEGADGITFAYRAVSKSGPPTIDINGIKGLRKIKFIN
jgi:filamentous hemagglutinin